MLDKAYILAGKATFTIRLGQHSLKDAKSHYTFRVKHKPASLLYQNKEVYFVSMLTGPDNTRSYSYVGCLDPQTGFTRLTAKSKFKEDSVPVVIIRRVLDRIWKNEGHVIAGVGWEVMHNGFCGRCGRV